MVRFSTAPSERTATRTATCDEMLTSCTERTAAVSWLRAENDRDVVGQPGEKLARALEQLFDLSVDMRVESTNLLVLNRAENPRERQVVDEVPVTAVCRDAAGGGVRLEKESLTLEG